ncbi:uncharacterized protein PAC_17153 [Phialocephala subalpina]|uniref:Uncharacterized protein n=1 Tax=Phialocephala subalpina TaxID=576137 RepID=A0A1L7XQD2_9HELO|nr:uncharacterized protein PAC_17153 [Phialocephala subalpina]
MDHALEYLINFSDGIREQLKPRHLEILDPNQRFQLHQLHPASNGLPLPPSPPPSRYFPVEPNYLTYHTANGTQFNGTIEWTLTPSNTSLPTKRPRYEAVAQKWTDVFGFSILYLDSPALVILGLGMFWIDEQLYFDRGPAEFEDPGDDATLVNNLGNLKNMKEKWMLFAEPAERKMGAYVWEPRVYADVWWERYGRKLMNEDIERGW